MRALLAACLLALSPALTAAERVVSLAPSMSEIMLELGAERRLVGLLGLRGSWQATGELKLEAKIDNLLDKDYQRALYEHEGERYGYRQEGRTALLGFVWTPRL